MVHFLLIYREFSLIYNRDPNMKISTFSLFNLSYIASLYAANNSSTQSIPSVIFDNASPNHTWVLTSEYSHNAFCEFDNCHLELPPIFHTENDIRQDVAFFNNNGTEILTYDVCDTAGSSSVVYPHDHTAYRCANYSGAKIKVTTTPQGVIAEAINNSVQNIQIIGERSPYEIVVTLFPSSNSSTNIIKDKNIMLILACTLGTLVACFTLLCIRYYCNKPTMMNNIHGFFNRKRDKESLIALEHIAKNDDNINDARAYL